MSAGAGNNYHMLQEAHQLMHNWINVRIGYIEIQGRKEINHFIIPAMALSRIKGITI